MKKAGAVLLGIAAFAAIPALAHDEGNRFGANLIGYQEVPALSTGASARWDAVIDERNSTVDWQLTYSGPFEGTVTQSHIHFGQRGVNGGISVFFCSNLGNGPAGTQACPQPTAAEPTVMISGTFTPANVIGPAGQGITAGQFDELIRAIRAGVTYTNIHTTAFPGGEIRGQVRRGHSRGDRD